jgi:Zn-dependent peptidase ImmA (M78 family)
MTRVILHNDAHADVRQRSNIAHELGHCFLGHEMTPPLREDGERNRDGSDEAEAEFFGGMLLISNEAADHIVRSGIELSAARTYGVSEIMLNYRLQTSGANIRARRRAANVAGIAVG